MDAREQLNVHLLLLSKASNSGAQDVRDTAEEASANSCVTFFNPPQHMDVSCLADRQELIYTNFTQTQGIV